MFGIDLGGNNWHASFSEKATLIKETVTVGKRKGHEVGILITDTIKFD